MNDYVGKYRGIVVDVNDPEERGRIRVLCPAVLGKKNISNWALPCFPPNTFTLPKKNDLVWMEFEDGDRDLPIWTGMFYTKLQFKTKFGNTYSVTSTTIQAEGNTNIVAGGNANTTAVGNANIVAGGDTNTTATGNININASGDVDIIVDGDFNTTTGGLNNLN